MSADRRPDPGKLPDVGPGPPTGFRSEPEPGSPEERAADLHALKVFLLWFGCCAAIAAIWLALSIWIDWN